MSTLLNILDFCYYKVMNFEHLLIVIIAILISVILHEVMHGLTAYWLGDDTAKINGRLSFNPIKHIDPIMSIAIPLLLAISGGPIFGGAKPVPINTYNLKGREWGMALVAIAGPLTNFILAFIFFAIFAIFYPYTNDLLGVFLLTGFRVNIGFCVFNLIPIPPLDGSRVLYAISPDGIRRFLASIEKYGIFFVFILVILFGGFLGAIMNGAMEWLVDLFTSLLSLK